MWSEYRTLHSILDKISLTCPLRTIDVYFGGNTPAKPKVLLWKIADATIGRESNSTKDSLINNTYHSIPQQLTMSHQKIRPPLQSKNSYFSIIITMNDQYNILTWLCGYTNKGNGECKENHHYHERQDHPILIPQPVWIKYGARSKQSKNMWHVCFAVTRLKQRACNVWTITHYYIYTNSFSLKYIELTYFDWSHMLRAVMKAMGTIEATEK